MCRLALLACILLRGAGANDRGAGANSRLATDRKDRLAAGLQLRSGVEMLAGADVQHRALDEHDEHEEDGHDEHEGHDEHDEEGHDEHDEHEGHDEHDEHDEHGEGGGSKSPNRARAWRNSMIASLLLTAVTAVGAFIRLPFAGALEETAATVARISLLSSAFACGAILATAVFLILFESTHLISARWQEESQTAWRCVRARLSGAGGSSTAPRDASFHAETRFGAMILAGYGAGMLTALLAPRAPAQVAEAEGAQLTHVRAAGSAALTNGDEELAATKLDELVPAKSVDRAFVFTIFFGDFIHNLVDGIFIANAFLDCRQTLGWTVTTATIAHEVAQEVSDFFLLITRGGLSVPKALAVNMVSGLSTFVGAAAFLWSEPGEGSRGLLLAFSGGVYIYIACTEAAENVVHNPSISLWDRALAMFCFIAGAVAIGLVLLDHLHCEAKEGGGDGHGH